VTERGSALVRPDPLLPSIEKARQALAVAFQNRDAPAAKSIRDQFEAVRAYVARRDGSLDLANKAAEIKVRAEWTLGRILRDMRERGERATASGGDRKSPSRSVMVKLSDLGITPNLASQSQRVATLAEDDLAEWLREQQKAKEEVSTAAALRLAAARREPSAKAQSRPAQPPQPEPEWGLERYEDSLARVSFDVQMAVVALPQPHAERLVEMVASLLTALRDRLAWRDTDEERGQS
jgi:hypothetical protein